MAVLPRTAGALRHMVVWLLLFGLALFGFGVWSAQQTPVVVRYAVVVPGLKSVLRIVQLSDTHASRIDMPPERLMRIVAQANGLRPDLIVLTGDYISGDPARWTPAETRAGLQPLRALRAPLGVYASLGNHDDAAATAAAFKGSPVRLLVGAGFDAGPVTIIGADNIDRGPAVVAAMQAAVRRASPAKPVIVFGHQPTYWLRLPTRPLLLLVGHTHGGQVKLPIIGAWAADAFYAAHQRGMFRRGVHQMIVSSGIGTTSLPIRIGVPPEIVAVTLYPGRNSGTDR